ncbi:hypothetical protein HY409_00090 [Candidatus Gottesmanbacteria bacterium]|nr:hypothetical protein [Candidatus Gottesmanbacteria bacterium]
MIEQRSYDLEIHAGPCSVNRINLREIYQIADIRVKNARGEFIRAFSGTRVVGLKSRTFLSSNTSEMGMDLPILEEQFLVTEDTHDRTPPSVEFARQIVADTDLVVATEIMMPDVQIPHYIGKIPPGKLLLWNPSVDQLGWHIWQTAKYARDHGWQVGIKNGKSLGTTLANAQDATNQEITELEKTWVGLASFAQNLEGRVVLIHRGVETPEKGLFRSAPVHEIARRAKRRIPQVRLFFDPSHSCGSNLRDQIVPITIEAMRMKDGNNFLYDGILVEAGTSDTDILQHITLDELRVLAEELTKFRSLRSPI